MVILSVVKQNCRRTLLLYYLLLSSTQVLVVRTSTTVTKYKCYRCISLWYIRHFLNDHWTAMTIGFVKKFSLHHFLHIEARSGWCFGWV